MESWLPAASFISGVGLLIAAMVMSIKFDRWWGGGWFFATAGLILSLIPLASQVLLEASDDGLKVEFNSLKSKLQATKRELSDQAAAMQALGARFETTGRELEETRAEFAQERIETALELNQLREAGTNRLAVSTALESSVAATKLLTQLLHDAARDGKPRKTGDVEEYHIAVDLIPSPYQFPFRLSKEPEELFR